MRPSSGYQLTSDGEHDLMAKILDELEYRLRRELAPLLGCSRGTDYVDSKEADDAGHNVGHDKVGHDKGGNERLDNDKPGRYDEANYCEERSNDVHDCDEAAYDGADEFDNADDDCEVYVNDDEVFWWESYSRGDENNKEEPKEEPQDIGGNTCSLRETETLIGGRYALASDLLHSQYTRWWPTVCSGRSIGKIYDVESDHTFWTTCKAIRGNYQSLDGGTTSLALGAIFVALVRFSTRWRGCQSAQKLANTRRSTRWRSTTP